MTRPTGRLGLVVAAVLLAAMLAGATPALGRATPSSPALVVVRFEPGAGATARHRALAGHALTVVDELPGTDFVLVRAKGGADLRALVEDAAVAGARPAATAQALGSVRPAPDPDDPLFPAQWHLRTIGIPRAWDASTGKGTVVAVLDTGVAYEDVGPFKKAPDLAGTTFVPGYDFVDDDDHPNDLPVGGKGSHGTAMAGTIAQTTGNGVGGAGVAPGASIMPVRVLDAAERGTTFNIAKGLRFAVDHGAKVANMSLGTTENAPELADAVAYATSKGVTVVASTGDDGTTGITYPAAYPEVLAVGATTYTNARAEYSNFGPELDLVAPGGDLEADENHDELDDGIVQQALYEISNSFCFCFRQGTSSAAAHVSGVAALVLAAGKARTPAEVRDRLVGTAADLGPPGRDDEYGAGLVQATRALGLAPRPGETPPTVGEGHHHDEEAAPPEAARRRPRTPALRESGGDGSDSSVATRLRRRRGWLLGAAGLVVLAYVVPYLRRRRKET